MERTAVETVGANFALWQADSLHDGIQCGEFQRCEVQTASDFIHHSLVFRTASGGIRLNILVHVAFEVLNHSASDELEFAL